MHPLCRPFGPCTKQRRERESGSPPWTHFEIALTGAVGGGGEQFAIRRQRRPEVRPASRVSCVSLNCGAGAADRVSHHARPAAAGIKTAASGNTNDRCFRAEAGCPIADHIPGNRLA